MRLHLKLNCEVQFPLVHKHTEKKVPYDGSLVLTIESFLTKITSSSNQPKISPESYMKKSWKF